MPLLYGRKIRLELAGLEIEEPRISVALTRSIDPTQDKGKVEIFNLNPNTAQRIVDRGRHIKVAAGYSAEGAAGPALIFEGRTQRAILERRDLSHVTSLTLGDEVRSSRTLSGHYNAVHEGNVSVRELMIDICSYGLKLPVSHASLELIPKAATFRNFYWPAGSAAGALHALLRPLGMTWFESDGVVRVNVPGRCQPDGPGIIVSSERGMVRSPIDTDEGVEVETLCEPRATLGAEVDLRVSGPRAGVHKIVAIEHALDNWEGAFLTFDTFVSAFADGIDGLWANTVKDVAIVAGVDSYKLSAKTFRDRVIDTGQRGGVSLGDTSFADYAMGKFGGWWTNKRMPAKSSHVQQAILYRKGRSATGASAGMRTAVCPHWNEVSIDDIYSGSAKGERYFTMHVLLGDVILVQPDAYAQVSFRVST